MPPASSSRIALFIDGANLHATSRTLGFDIDYKRLLAEFSSRGVLLRAFYYSAMDPELSSLRPLLDWLDYNGYTVVTRLSRESVDAGGGRKVRGNLEVDLAVDVMELAADIDEMILFSGDGDFRRLSRRCSAAASASRSFPRRRASRRSSPTNCVGRPTSSSTWRNCAPGSAATPSSGRPRATGASVLP